MAPPGKSHLTAILIETFAIFKEALTIANYRTIPYIK